MPKTTEPATFPDHIDRHGVGHFKLPTPSPDRVEYMAALETSVVRPGDPRLNALIHTISMCAAHGDIDKMIKKPASVQRELAEARRILRNVKIPPVGDAENADT